jgi:hypothetical protein
MQGIQEVNSRLNSTSSESTRKIQVEIATFSLTSCTLSGQLQLWIEKLAHKLLNIEKKLFCAEKENMERNTPRFTNGMR